MKIFNTLTAVLFSTSFAIMAQTPNNIKPAEKLTTTESLASRVIASEINQVNADAANFQADIEKAHPGYTFNFRTGELVPVPSKENKSTKDSNDTKEVPATTPNTTPTKK